jgi:hypothetical protein
MKWIWRVYAVLYLLVAIPTVVFFVQDPTIRYAINACTALISLVAIVGLAAERRIFIQVFWKFWFVLAIAEEIYDAVVADSVSLYVLIPIIPYLIALFVYAFASARVWNSSAEAEVPAVESSKL